MINNLSVAVIVAIVCIVAIIFAVPAAYISHRDRLISHDVEIAINRGIDPITVRCAYANEKDQICLVYAASRKSFPVELVK